MECVSCGSPRIENKDRMLCASCNRLERKAAAIRPSDNNSPIEKRSAKGKEVDRKYLNRLRTWKRGKKCSATFVHDCQCPAPDKGPLTVHHMVGRGTHFYDEYAEEREIPLTLDERFWRPLCMNAHRYIEEHPKFAHEMGYSYLRLAESIKLITKL